MLLGGVEGTDNIICHVHLIEVDKELRRIGYLRKFSGLWHSRRQGGERNRLQQITTGPHRHRLFPLVIGIVHASHQGLPMLPPCGRSTRDKRTAASVMKKPLRQQCCFKDGASTTAVRVQYPGTARNILEP